MKCYRITLFLLLTSILSCKKGGSDIDQSIAFKVDGVFKKTTDVAAVRIKFPDGYTVITGKFGGKTHIQFQLYKPKTGLINIPTPDNKISYLPDDQLGNTMIPIVSGEIMATSYTDGVMTGTFQFSWEGTVGAVKTITEGTFTAKVTDIEY